MNDVYLTDKNGWDVLKDSTGRMLGAVKFKDDKVRIDITEYDHYGEEFDLNNKDDVREFIKAFSSIYGQCDNDRLSNDTDANTEFYKREAIQAVPQKHLLLLNRQLPYITDEDEKLKVEHQIEILKEVTEEVDKLLE